MPLYPSLLLPVPAGRPSCCPVSSSRPPCQTAERMQPSVIFFDEFDGLAPARVNSGGSAAEGGGHGGSGGGEPPTSASSSSSSCTTHGSIVATLLALMDGVQSRGSVVVIAATNRVSDVDPALRRPGR